MWLSREPRSLTLGLSLCWASEDRLLPRSLSLSADQGSASTVAALLVDRSGIASTEDFILKITNKPPRFKRDNAVYFLTFGTYQRVKLLHQAGVPEMLIENLGFYGARLKKLIAYTIMPEHIHLMVEVGKVGSLSAFLRDFKKRTSGKIRSFANADSQYIWLRGTRDHCIRQSHSNKDFNAHISYLFFNSWKHLGIPPRAFPYHNLEEAIARGFVDARSFPA